MSTKTLEQKSADNLAGLQIDLLSKLRGDNMTFEQLNWFKNLSFAQREALMGKQPEREVILNLMSGGRELNLDACDGKQTIANAKNTFSYIDSDFKDYGTNKTGSATEVTPIDVYEMVKDAPFTKMFGSLNPDLDALCLTQSQILNFIAKHRDWLRTEGYATFFLFKVGEEFFVASVYVRSAGLDVHMDRFGRGGDWSAGFRHRVVVPQLAV